MSHKIVSPFIVSVRIMLLSPIFNIIIYKCILYNNTYI